MLSADPSPQSMRKVRSSAASGSVPSARADTVKGTEPVAEGMDRLAVGALLAPTETVAGSEVRSPSDAVKVKVSRSTGPAPWS